jgi:hypothetical protein
MDCRVNMRATLGDRVLVYVIYAVCRRIGSAGGVWTNGRTAGVLTPLVSALLRMRGALVRIPRKKARRRPRGKRRNKDNISFSYTPCLSDSDDPISGINSDY